MSHNSVQHPRVRFALEQPLADKNSFEISPEKRHSFDDLPPPWEPQFEDLSRLPVPLHRRPLDPPPTCFSIPSPIRIRSHDFPTFRIPSVSDKLTDGFRALYPQNVLDGHGITRADWVRFLQDLDIAACLSSEGLSAIRSRAPVAPSPIYRIFPTRTFGAVYDGRFARSPVDDVRVLVRIWNECAFERRKIRVTLQIRPGRMHEKKRFMLVVESL